MSRLSRAATSLVITQVSSSLTDNIIRAATMAMMLSYSKNAGAMSTLAFVLPYIIFSPVAGQTGDRFAKTRLILLLKLAEIPLVIAMILAILFGWSWLMLVITLLSGVQSSFLSPARLALIPEIAPDNILRLNSLMDGTMFLAILAGTSLGFCLPIGAHSSTMHGTALVIGAALVSLSIGVVTACFLRRQHPDTAADKNGTFETSWFRMTASLVRHVQECRKGRDLIALSAFWALASVLLADAEPLARALQLPSESLRVLSPVMSVGMGCGALLTALIARQAVVVPAVVMTVLCCCFVVLTPGPYALIALCVLSFLTCAAGGVLSSNLYANAMHGTGTHTSSVMAANNIFNSLMMAGASVILISIGHFSPLITIALFALAALPAFMLSAQKTYTEK